MVLKRVVNVLCRVSVRMKVPEMKVTPSTIAIAVSASRSLCARSPLRVTFPISAAERSHALEHRVRRRIAELADDLAVREEDHPTRVGGADRIVGHHHDRTAH